MDVEMLRQKGEKAREEALQLAKEEEGWNKTSKDMGEGVVLEWRDGVPGSVVREDGVEGGVGEWRCWRLKTTLEAESGVVERVIMDIEGMQEWNPALTKTQVILLVNQTV